MSGQDFTVAITSGTTMRAWEDPTRPPDTLYLGDPGAPSRLNPHPGIPHKMVVGQVGTQIELTATVGGVAGPLDSTLGGRLFWAWDVERAQAAPISFSSPAGQSSIQRFTPTAEGHYTIGIARDTGGAVLIHIDVEVP